MSEFTLKRMPRLAPRLLTALAVAAHRACARACAAKMASNSYIPSEQDLAKIANIPPSEEAPHTERITKSELEEFFNTRAREYTCACCGHDVFDYFSHSDSSPAMAQVPIASEDTHAPLGFVPAIVLHCMSCGYLLQFYWHTVLDWSKERRGGGA